MDRNKLIGKKVEHVTWGAGTITGIKGGYVEIVYKNSELKKYQFPTAFIKYLKASEPEIQKEIEDEIQSTGRRDEGIALERLAPDEIPAQDYPPKHRAFKDAVAKPRNAFGAQRIDSGIINRAPAGAFSGSQKEGSPAWFREQAALTEHQYHFKVAERIRENFIKMYSPDKLMQMSGEELLHKVFGSEDSMMYELTYSRAPSNIFGAAAHYKYLWIVYSTKKSQWNYYRGGRSRIISIQEAMQRAKEIRDLLVMGASIIKNHKTPNCIADYRYLEQDLSFIFIHSYTWVLKYYQMLYPEWFPCMYGDYTLVRALGIFGLPEHGDRYLNLGEIALFTQKCGIPNVLLSHIYGIRWGWTETLMPCENAASNLDDSRLSVSEYNRRNR